MGSGVLLLAALASLLALTVCYSVASVRARRLSDQRASLLEEVGLLPSIVDRVTAPVLPREASAWLPLAGKTRRHPSITFYDASFQAGYGAFRHDLPFTMADGGIALAQDGELRSTSHSIDHR